MNLHELIAEVLDHIRGMWRYRWLSTLLAWVILLAGCFHVYSLPDQYQASVRIYVDTDSLIGPLMSGLTAGSRNMSEVQLLSTTVLSRPNLTDVAYRTDLDLRARTPEEFEKLVSGMRENVTISGGRDNIFTIQYKDPSRQKAYEVVDALRNTFVGGALGNLDNQIGESEKTLRDEINFHEDRLAQAEQARAKFRRDNLGLMPNEFGDYYSRLQAAAGALAEIERALEITRTKRDVLRRQIAGEEPVIGIMPSGGLQCSQRSYIDARRQDLAEFKLRYTDKHPVAESLQANIDQLTAECEEEIEAARADGSYARLAASPDGNPVYQNLRVQLNEAEVEIASLEAQAQERRNQTEQLRQNVDKITEVEAALAQLNRDYDVIRGRLDVYYQRWEALQATKRTEPVADTTQFRTIDPPFADQDPVGPARPALIGAILALALGAGGALAFVLNQVRPVFFTREKLRAALEFPVIGSVTMLLPQEVIVRRRLEAVTWSFACLMMLAVAGVAIVLAPKAGPIVRAFLQGVQV